MCAMMFNLISSIMKKMLVFLAVGLFLSACGSPKTLVKVRNNADNTETTISATTGDGGTTSVTVSPKIVIDSNKVDVKPF